MSTIERRRFRYALAAFLVTALALARPILVHAGPASTAVGEILVHVLAVSPDGSLERVRLEFPAGAGGDTLPGSIEVNPSPEKLDVLRSAIRVLHRSTGPDGLERTIFRLAGELPRACGGPVPASGPFEAITLGAGRVVLRDLGRDVAVTFRLVGEPPELRPRMFGSFFQFFLCLRAHLAFQDQCFDSCKEDCGDAGVESVRSSDFCGRRGTCECTCQDDRDGNSGGGGQEGDPEDARDRRR